MKQLMASETQAKKVQVALVSRALRNVLVDRVGELITIEKRAKEACAEVLNASDSDLISEPPIIRNGLGDMKTGRKQLLESAVVFMKTAEGHELIASSMCDESLYQKVDAHEHAGYSRFKQGFLLENAGKDSEAAEAYWKAITAFDDAAIECGRLAKSACGRADGMMRTGEIKEAIGEYEKAAQGYDKQANLFTDQLYALNFLVVVLVEKGIGPNELRNLQDHISRKHKEARNAGGRTGALIGKIKREHGLRD